MSVSMETEDGTALKYRRTDRHVGKCRRVSGNASSLIVAERRSEIWRGPAETVGTLLCVTCVGQDLL